MSKQTKRMAKAQNKTVESQESVTDFIQALSDETKKKDCFTLVQLMQKHSCHEPKMWGPSIIGFGTYHYQYDSGREGDAPLLAFSPRKAEISLYLSSSFENREALLQKLGKHKSAKACVYVKKLSDINLEVLEELISLSLTHVKSTHSGC